MTSNCSNSLAVFNQSDMTHKFFSNFTLSNLLLVLATSFAASSFANTVSGELNFLDASGAVTTTYEAGDVLQLRVSDLDRNSDAAVAESISVLLTSTTEDTGTPASVTDPVAGSSNVGDGTVVVSTRGIETTSEDWELTAVSQTSFLVTGSVSGTQQTLNVGADYETDGGELGIRIDQGSLSFSVGDKYTFTSTAAEVVGETITLTETDLDSGVFLASVTLNETSEEINGNGELELVPGDRITAFYDDPQGDFGDPELSRHFALYAKTV